jgi:hypothetical protein
MLDHLECLEKTQLVYGSDVLGNMQTLGDRREGLRRLGARETLDERGALKVFQGRHRENRAIFAMPAFLGRLSPPLVIEVVAAFALVHRPG